MGFISFASLVGWQAFQEFCVKKDSEAQGDSLLVSVHRLPWFRLREAAPMSASDFGED